jgi:hypothetical protein
VFMLIVNLLRAGSGNYKKAFPADLFLIRRA